MRVLKSPPPKKAVSPSRNKVKGQIRNKTGCYTCRIRRKKCDEEQDDKGRCSTCVRLRIQCLGFGSKRPEYLKAPNAVRIIRERIKDFLANNGMIKGQSGAGAARSRSDDDPNYDAILILHPDNNEYSSSSTPATPRWASPIGDYDYSSYHRVSDIRGDVYMSAKTVDGPYSQAEPLSLADTADISSPSNSFDDTLLSDDNLSYNTQSLAVNAVPAVTYHSSFGKSYTYVQEPEDDYALFAWAGCPPIPAEPILEASMVLLERYREEIVHQQYAMADPDILLDFHGQEFLPFPRARDAALILAQTHRHRIDYAADQEALKTPDNEQQVKNLLQRVKAPLTDFIPPDMADRANAALIMISAFLFDGGGGEWYIWFKLACQISQMVFAWYPDPATSLHNAVPFNFIIKRTMWFDVLAAVTLQEPPVFVDVYRQVFRPTYSGIVGEGVTGVVPRQLDMMNVMGCANHVCWALAEASVLSYQASEGLTVREVYRKITEIEGCLQPNFMPPQASSSAEGATGLARQLSADIFRAATLLYLHAILERDQPANPEIKHDVDEVMAAFGRAQEHADVLEKVARTTVFALFLAGALTTRRIHRQTIVGLLQYNRRGRVGNRWTIERTLGDLWKDRNRNGPSVDWRKVLRDNQLLLV